MTQQFNLAQTFGKNSFETARKAFGPASSSAQAIVVETADYAKKSLEQGAATVQQLVGVKTLDKVIEIQTDYVKSAYDGFVAHATKTRELYTKLAQDGLAPFSALRPAAQSAVASAKAAARAK